MSQWEIFFDSVSSPTSQMSNGHSFSCAVRPLVVVKYVGQLCIVLSALTLVPLLVSIIFEEDHILFGMMAVEGVLLLAGGISYFLPKADQLQANEGLVITALMFLLTPILMTYPMVQAGLSWEDGFFESVSAITTTGLTMIDQPEHIPRSIVFLRSWMQWYGGLGIIILSVALLLGQGMISRRLAEAESSLNNLVTTTHAHARRMLWAYGTLTGVGIVGVWSLGADLFPAVLHVLSAVSTGGFSVFASNLAGFEFWRIRAAIMVLAFCGSLALPLYYHLSRKGLKLLTTDIEVWGVFIGAVLTSILLLLTLGPGVQGKGWDTMGHAFLIGFSAQTGTGFTTLPIGDFEPDSKAALFGSMLVGGSVGSTAGGLKVWRFLIILGLIWFVVKKSAAPPHAVINFRLGGRSIGEEEVQRAVILAGLFVLVIFLSWLPFLVQGYDPLDSLFDVISAIATVGLSTNVTHVTLEPGLKYLLCADMLLGRLEFIAFLVLCYPRTWVSKKMEVT